MSRPRTRFVILTRGRSGSTLLVRLLQSHPEIHCDDELFNPKFQAGAGPRTIRAFRHVPGPLIAHCARRTTAPVYGFKLLTPQVKHPERAVHGLVARGWRVVYLRRTATIDQALSLLVARKVQRWHGRDPGPLASPRLRIEGDELDLQLTRLARFHEREAAIVDTIPHLRLDYEQDLLHEERWAETGSRLCAYLEVADLPLRTDWPRLYSEPYSQIVENYRELVADR